LLLIVPGGPTTSATGNSTKRSRFWHHHLSHFGKVIPVTMHLSNSARGVSVGQCLDHMIGAVQAKVLEVSKVILYLSLNC
jgi:regulatory NSL complex subunit 3